VAVSDGGEADITAVMVRLIARLRVEREERVGLTQARLAARLEVTTGVVRDWESAREYPTLLHFIWWSHEFELRLALEDSEGKERRVTIPDTMEPWAVQEVRRLATTLRATRNQRSITQLWLSARLGVSEITVNRWEKGASRPRPTALLRWARVLGLSVTLAPL